MAYRHFDPVAAMLLLRCSRSDLRWLLEQCLHLCDRTADALHLAFDTGELRSVERILEQLRAALGLVAAERARDSATRLQQSAIDGSLRAQDLPPMMQTLAELSAELAAFVDMIPARTCGADTREAAAASPPLPAA